MQALMLAAGMGRRLQKYTKDQTKCMLRIADKTLLETACDALKAAGISKMILVVGYKGQDLINYATTSIKDMEFEFVVNEDYSITNNIYSLYLAREHLKSDDTILLESDLIFEPEIIKNMVDNPVENLVAVAKYEYWMDGTVCTLDGEGNIREFVSKKEFDFADVDRYYKTVNIYKFSKEFSEKKYIPFLETYINVYGTNQYYESVLKIISRINKMDLMAYDVEKLKWYEVDNSHDYDIATTMFQKTSKKLLGYEQHYGGYWRFPKVYDYCYLVNPYFPNEAFKSQLQYMFDTLLTQYPSGLRIQKLNSARMFDIDEECITVGNGAGELISALGKSYRGKIGFQMPVFNEYIRCFEQCEKECINADDECFSLKKEELIRVADKVDMLVIVNPDNPSGQMLDYKDVIEIVEYCQKRNVKCLIDESFVDFADSDRRFTLLNKSILRKYTNLIVIKSISKSFGVPGLRAGILATGDKEIIRAVESELPIWNINSFAEYFFEIINLHMSEYWEACNKLAQERSRLKDELRKNKFLEVYDSQANYVMCKVVGIKSRDLANILIDEYDILIKDLSTKTGFDGKQYIRVAIKDKKENDILINALKEIGVRYYETNAKWNDEGTCAGIQGVL